jgi:uncharacterized protein YukE
MIKIKREELRGKQMGEIFDFPEFTGELIQLANRKANGTQRKIMGKTAEMIERFGGKSYEEWRDWYETERPGAVDQATDKIFDTVKKMARAMEKLDRELVRKWVLESVLKKTYAASRIQEVVLKKIACIKKDSCRLSDEAEQDAGIDGFIGNRAYRIRPVSHYFKPPVEPPADCETVYFEKGKDGLKVYYEA